MKTGTVFEVKEFAVFDGPSVRQTVFLKGCPLRCNWCHNPEGLETQPQLMVSGGCDHCGNCKRVCTHESCIHCGACVGVCPRGLRKIVGKRMTSEELVNLLNVNSEYYTAYGGGVTFTGGEPMMQGEFLKEVLDGLPDIHKAIETSAYTDSSTFKEITGRTDYIMVDIKHFDGKVHKRYTGVDNKMILDNIESLFDGNIPFVVRIPLIPGVNDTRENYENIAKFLSKATALQRVELMPYHKTAGAKYGMIGKAYRPMFEIDRPVLVSQGIFRDYGIRSEVL